MAIIQPKLFVSTVDGTTSGYPTTLLTTNNTLLDKGGGTMQLVITGIAGVTSFAQSGQPPLTGAVTLSGSTNVGLAQTGQNVQIFAGAGSSSDIYTPTNVTITRGFDATLTSLDEVAAVLGSLIKSLQGVGIVK